MDLLQVKLLAVVVLGVASLICGLIPLKMRKYIASSRDPTQPVGKRRELVVSFLLCFGAGVLFAAVMIHMLPEIREGFGRAKSLKEAQNATKASLHSGHDAHSHVDHDHSDHLHNHDMNLETSQDGLNGGGKGEPHDNDVDGYHKGHLHDHHDHDRALASTHDHSHHHPHDHNDAEHTHHHDRDHKTHPHKDMQLNQTPTKEEDQGHIHNEDNPKEDKHDHSEHVHGENHSVDLHDQNSHHMENIHDHSSHRAEDVHDHSSHPAEDVHDDISHPSENLHDYSSHHTGEVHDHNSHPSEDEHDHGSHGHDHHIHHEEQVPTGETETTPFLDYSTTDVPEETTMAPLRRRKRQEEPALEVVLPKLPSPREAKEISFSEPNTQHLHAGHDHSDHEDHSGHDHAEHSYPLTELVICLGFFIVYFIEELIHWAFSINHHGHSHGVSGGHGHLAVLEEGPKPTAHRNGVVATESTYKKGLGRRAAWRPAHVGIDNPVFVGEKDPAKWTPDSTDSSQESSGRCYSSMNLATGEVPDVEIKQKRGCGQIMMENVRSLLMVVALSLHSSFEGLAIGLQENARDTWYLTLAVSAHKLVIQFCVGMELVVIGANVKTIILYVVVMSLTNPVGAAIGMFLTHDGAFFNDPEQLFLITTLQAFAAGTILYVTFFEILERERSKHGGRFIKFFALLLGFVFLAVIENFGGHSHGPSEHSH